MFGQWRLTLRQAEEAVRAERFDEALELAGRPEVAEHRQAGELRNKIALRLVDRARDFVRHGHSSAAWHDLRKAELAGAPGAKVAQVRGELTERGAAEVLAALDACDPQQAIILADDLRARGADSPQLRRFSEAAACCVKALKAKRIGEFPRTIECLETAQKLLDGRANFELKLKSAQSDRQRGNELRTQLQAALVAQNWADVFRSADMFLELAPDCREIRQVRDEAMRRLGVHVAAATNQVPPQHPEEISPARKLVEGKNGSRTRFILWVDGVGGFLVCQGNVVTLGQANPGCTVDVPILGDLSRQHATIVRDGEGYLVRSEREISVNDRVTRQTTLKHGDLIRLGRSVVLRFSLPCPVSETARLELASRHRLHLSLGGIVLMAETCVLGPSGQTHVQVPAATEQVVLYRQNEGLCCRGKGVVEVDGHPHEGLGQLRWSSRVVAGDISFSLEPVGSPLSQV